jgi:hypothetical protein
MDAVREAYGSSLNEGALRPYLYIVKKLDARQRKFEDEINAQNEGLPSLDSRDRAAFPTMKEASAAALRQWKPQ